jgi:uncharacterized integral membrane protein
MKTFLKWLALAPLILVALVFAVVNRHLVTIVFDPFNNDIPGLSLTVPLFLALFLSAMIGVIFGGVATWLSQGRHRRSAREARAELANLRAQADRLRLTPGLPSLEGPRRDAA